MNQKIITDLLPSNQLKCIISQTNHEFSIIELLIITNIYSKTYDDRINKLEYLVDNCENQQEKELIQDVIKNRKESFEKMITPEGGTVYFVEIEIDADSYTEKYICKNYETALKTVQHFSKEYEVQFTDYSYICIKKCTVFDDAVDFYNDELGEILLTKDLEVESAEYWSIKNPEDITDCENRVLYPKFLKELSPVKFINHSGIHYGLQIDSFRDDEYDDAYVIYLNSKSVNCSDLSNFQNAHDHIPIPLIEQITVDELPQKEKSNYFRLIDYLKTENII